MTTRQKHLLHVLPSLTLAACFTLWACWPPSTSEINRQNIGKIEHGMARKQVREILHGQGRDETGGTGRLEAHRISHTGCRDRQHAMIEEWIGDEWAVRVTYVDDAVVTIEEGPTVGREDGPFWSLVSWTFGWVPALFDFIAG